MKSLLFAKIIIDISHEAVDRPFTYIVPEDLTDCIAVGDRVEIPFGKGNSIKKGVVVELCDHADIPAEKLKYVLSISEKDLSLSDKRIYLAGWIKRNYGSTMSAALKTVLPVRSKVSASVKKTIVRKASLSEIYVEHSV